MHVLHQWQPRRQPPLHRRTLDLKASEADAASTRQRGRAEPLPALTLPRALPQRPFGLPGRTSKPATRNPLLKREHVNVPDRIRTYDLRFLRPGECGASAAAAVLMHRDAI